MPNNGRSLSQELDEIFQFEEELKAEKEILLKKSLSSDDPNALIKARNYQLQQFKSSQHQQGKAFIFDPQEVSPNPGWKPNYFSISPGVLRRMGRTPYVRTVINTRVDQVADFAEYQQDKYSNGWVIEKKRKQNTELSDSDKKEIDRLSSIIENCGKTDNKENGARNWTKESSFEKFIRKLTKDSLELDAATFEVIENRKGGVVEFYVTDSASMYLADDYESDRYSDSERRAAMKDGFYPHVVQVLNNEIQAEFYPWELCFGVRNPSSEMWRNGYGFSELNSLIQTVTALLNADHYNSNFFKVGSSPKGILAVKGGINQRSLEEFKQQWRTEMTGVENAHRIPVLNSEKAEWINTHTPNKDMEFSHYHQFLIRLLCVLYRMSPQEAGLEGEQGSGGSMIKGGGDKDKEVAYSKSKGLKPILKFFQRKINKYIVERENPNFTFRFVGLETNSQEQELDNDTKSVQYVETYNEVRERKGMERIKEDWADIPLNPVALQAKQAEMQMQQMGGSETEEFFNNSSGQGGEEEKSFMDDMNDDENPIKQNFEDYIEKLNEQVGR